MTPQQERVYRMCRTKRDQMMHALDGFGSAFRAGYYRPDARPNRWDKTSLAEAAFRAGRDEYRLDERENKRLEREWRRAS